MGLKPIANFDGKWANASFVGANASFVALLEGLHPGSDNFFFAARAKGSVQEARNGNAEADRSTPLFVTEPDPDQVQGV